MKYFSLNFMAVSPLAIRADHAPGRAGGASYISGTTLMGSLAAVYRLMYEKETEQFERLFLRGLVEYPNLYPAAFKSESLQNAQRLPVYPIPKTAQSCKRFSGFRAVFADEKDVDEPRHGVRDTLFDWAMFELAKKSSLLSAPEVMRPLQKHKFCIEEGLESKRPMDRFTGFYRRSNAGNHDMMAAKVDTMRLQMHTGINRHTGTVEESILYSRAVFEESMPFWGMVKLPDDDDLARAFESFINEVGQTGLVRVGTGRTRGMGKASISAELLDASQYSFTQFREHLNKFNDKLREYVDEAFEEKAEEVRAALHPFYFALTLHSPAILCDDQLRYRGTITVETLRELGVPTNNLRPIYQAASTRQVMGWNDLWGLPRMHEYAIDTGSVFLFASTSKPDNELIQALYRLEEEGIGRRRAEGFGRVCICDPFHLEVTLR